MAFDGTYGNCSVAVALPPIVAVHGLSWVLVGKTQFGVDFQVHIAVGVMIAKVLSQDLRGNVHSGQVMIV